MFHRGAFSSGVCQGAATQCRRRALGCRGQGVEKQGSGTLKDAPRMCYRKSVSQMQRSICEHGDFCRRSRMALEGPLPRVCTPIPPAHKPCCLRAHWITHTHTHNSSSALGAMSLRPCVSFPFHAPFFPPLPCRRCLLPLAPSKSSRRPPDQSVKKEKRKKEKKKKTHTQRQTECPVVPFAVLLITRVWYAAVDRSLSLT